MKRKNISKTLLSITALLVIGCGLLMLYLHWELNHYESVVLVIPNEYEGWIRVVEDKENADPPYGPALENGHVLELHVGDDHLLKVNSIRDFSDWAKISMGFEWVEPIVYYADAECKDSVFNVFGEAVYLSDTEFCFWTGKRDRLNEAYAFTGKTYVCPAIEKGVSF